MFATPVFATSCRRWFSSRSGVTARSTTSTPVSTAPACRVAGSPLGDPETAGEILLTSWDRDGTRDGYDLDLVGKVASSVSVPVIASGGANEAWHLIEALEAGASAALIASILHDGDTTVGELKQSLTEAGIRVRP